MHMTHHHRFSHINPHPTIPTHAEVCPRQTRPAKPYAMETQDLATHTRSFVDAFEDGLSQLEVKRPLTIIEGQSQPIDWVKPSEVRDVAVEEGGGGSGTCVLCTGRTCIQQVCACEPPRTIPPKPVHLFHHNLLPSLIKSSYTFTFSHLHAFAPLLPTQCR